MLFLFKLEPNFLLFLPHKGYYLQLELINIRYKLMLYLDAFEFYIQTSIIYFFYRLFSIFKKFLQICNSFQLSFVKIVQINDLFVLQMLLMRTCNAITTIHQFLFAFLVCANVLYFFSFVNITRHVVWYLCNFSRFHISNNLNWNIKLFANLKFKCYQLFANLF